MGLSSSYEKQCLVQNIVPQLVSLFGYKFVYHDQPVFVSEMVIAVPTNFSESGRLCLNAYHQSSVGL